MKPAVVAASLTILLSSPLWSIDAVQAAQGDRLSVSKQNVNIRTGPSTTAEVLLTINAGEEIIEIAAKGDWFFVDFPNLGQKGWIYGPLIDPPGTVPAQPAPQQTPIAAETAEPAPLVPQTAPAAPAEPAPSAPLATATPPSAASQSAAAAGGGEPAAVTNFRETVIELNKRAVSVAGIHLFTDVRSSGGGGVQVLATDTWTSVPEAGQTSYMNALFERWQSMATGLGPLSLQILDPGGNVVMQRSDS